MLLYLTYTYMNVIVSNIRYECYCIEHILMLLYLTYMNVIVSNIYLLYLTHGQY